MATLEQQKAFIATIAPVVQAEAQKRGYAICSAAIAQACVESAYGTSSLAYKHHNYWGMKTGSKWTGPSVNMKTKEEYQPGVLTGIRDNFRCYPDLSAGVVGYYTFISADRYKALKSATSAQDYLQKIKNAGYCTSSTYVNTCMTVVKKHQLETWDGVEVEPLNPYPQPKKLLRMGSKGNDVKWVQWELGRHGYKLTVDGIWGKKTEAAIRDFQTKKKISVDGIVGPQTIAALKS